SAHAPSHVILVRVERDAQQPDELRRRGDHELFERMCVERAGERMAELPGKLLRLDLLWISPILHPRTAVANTASRVRAAGFVRHEITIAGPTLRMLELL